MPLSSTILIIFFLAVILHLFLVFSFNFGVFDSYFTSRLSLPLHLLFILTAPFIFKRYGRNVILFTIGFSIVSLYLVFLNLPASFVSTAGLQFLAGIIGFIGLGMVIWQRSIHPMTGLIITTAAYILTIGMPVGHSHRISQRAATNDVVMAELEFLEAHKEERILWVSSAPYSALLTRTNCLPIAYMLDDPATMEAYLQKGTYDSIFIMRLYKQDDEKVFQPIDPIHNINEEIFQMEPVLVENFGMYLRLRLDRLVGIKIPANIPNTP